jgi:hypothetical protein
MTLLREWSAKAITHLLLGAGAGVFGTVLIMLAQKEPARVIEVIAGWGPGSFIGLVAVVLVARGFDRVADAQLQAASSQQNLADAVRQIAEKDDSEREEQRRLLSFVGSQQEKILSSLESLAQRFDEKARGAHA